MRIFLSLGLLVFMMNTGIAADLFVAPPVEVIREKMTDWINSQDDAETTAKQAAIEEWAAIEPVSEKHPAGLSTVQLLEKAVDTFARLDADTGSLVNRFEFGSGSAEPVVEAYEDLDLSDPFHAAQVQLQFARHLSQRRMYDEALTVFEEIDPQQVIDPASLFFYRACAEHQLFLKTEGLESVNNLLQNTENVPARYRQVATLVKADLEGMKEKTLGHVASKMNDSERRLDLGRTGPRVQKVHDEIIVLLDEIIEKMEQQAGGGGGGGGQSSGQPNNTNQSSGPADESTVKGAPAPGNVDDKDFTEERGRFPGLPDKEIARSRDIINRSFPSHYQDAIEEYTEGLAKLKAVRDAGQPSGDSD